MKQSLYSILHPLITQKKDGILSLHHEDGDTATIVLKNGLLVGVETGRQQGLEAGRVLAMWIRFSSTFVENAVYSNTITGLDSTRYMSFLSKIEKRSPEIQEAISFDGNRFKFKAQDLKGNREFKPDELKIALALVGKASVKEIVQQTGIPDLQVLIHIYTFNRLGLVESLRGEEPLEEKQRVLFINSLTEALSEYLGPASELIFSGAFEGLESHQGMIYRSDLPQFVLNISTHLDGNDSLTFKKWVKENILKSLNT